MKIKFLNHEFKNPVIAASGTFDIYENMIYSPEELGGFSSKGLTLYPQKGNPGQRVHEVASGMMNSIGLQNEGIVHFIENDLKELLKIDSKLLVNLGGNTLEEYIEGARLLDKTEAPFIELNISCPNVDAGGMAFGMECNSAKEVVKAVKSVTKKPLIVKLSPNAGDLIGIALACEEAGADAISLINTFTALAIDVHKRKPVFHRKTAGLSGPCIFPIALRMVNDVAKAVNIPIIGIGGISSGEDAIGMIMAGAHLVQIGAEALRYPSRIIEIIEEMKEYKEKYNIKDWEEIRGII